jgi:hypothetical protein
MCLVSWQAASVKSSCSEVQVASSSETAAGFQVLNSLLMPRFERSHEAEGHFPVRY